MGVGQPHQIEHALHRTVFARRSVQRVEHDVGFGFGELDRDIARHIDRGDAVPERLQRLDDVRAGHQRHVALGRPAAHQDCDVETHESPLPFRGEGWERGCIGKNAHDCPSPRPSPLKGRGRFSPTR
ncbi:hypothetical protein D9M73_130530 [compost metagenome]